MPAIAGELSGEGMAVAEVRLVEPARAKINLTLSVVGKRADGFHELDSLVTFASLDDRLSFRPGQTLSLAVQGPFAGATGDVDSNLVLKAAAALARLRPGLSLGGFVLEKRLPVAAGLGGGSADAAAALRLLARANGLAPNSAELVQAAEETGSDVPVCLAGGSRMMRGRGEVLGPVLPLPSLPAVLANPGAKLETAQVFKALAWRAGKARPASFAPPPSGAEPADWLRAIAHCGNDLEAPAIRLNAMVATVRSELAAQRGCRLARMTGSGATVVGLFADDESAEAAAQSLAQTQPGWWVRAATLGDDRGVSGAAP